MKTKSQSFHTPKKEKKAENYSFSAFAFPLWKESTEKLLTSQILS